MRFKPFTPKYDFTGAVLIKDYPEFLVAPIASWLYSCLEYTDTIASDSFRNKAWLESSFNNNLQTIFRETIPGDWNNFLSWLFRDSERTTNFLALCLQNYAKSDDATCLEHILATGGSAYTVIKTNPEASDYEEGVYDLGTRVPDPVERMSKSPLSSSALLTEAWNSCYARNPDYEKAVSKSCDFIEGFLRDKYWPTESRTKSIVVAVSEFRKSPNILKYKGSTFVEEPVHLISLLSGVGDIRGQHTTGKGRRPTSEEAEFILHTVIYIWYLHQ